MEALVSKAKEIGSGSAQPYLSSAVSVFSATQPEDLRADDVDAVISALSLLLKNDGVVEAHVGLLSSAITEVCSRARAFPEDKVKKLKPGVLKLLSSVTGSAQCRKLSTTSKKSILKLLLLQLQRNDQAAEEDARVLIRVALPVFLKVSPSPAPACPSTTSRYVPPHQRGSDSEASDSEPDGKRSRSLAFLCLQCTECLEPWLLQPYLLQVSGVLCDLLSSRASNNLKIIAAKVVSKLLEGPKQRTYLSMSEVPEASYALNRGFTTLSMQLGRLLMNLHTTLQSAILKESSMSLLSSELRALSALIGVSPYNRLEPELAQRVFRVLCQKFDALISAVLDLPSKDVSPEEFSVFQSATSCFTLLVSKKEVPFQADMGCLTKYVDAMARVVCGNDYPPLVRLDNCVSLHRFTKGLQKPLVPYASSILLAIQKLLAEVSQSDVKDGKSSLSEKICQQGIRIMAELLHLVESESIVIFCEEIMEEGMACNSSLIRSAVLQSITHLNSDLAKTVQGEKVFLLVREVCRYAEEERNSITIRSAACKALGSLLCLERVHSAPHILNQGLSALTSLGSTTSGTLQISLAWSIANVCDALREETQRSEGMSTTLADCVSQSLPSIAKLSMFLATRNDKIRCNAIRCIGYIFDISETLGIVIEDFSENAVNCILESMAKGNTKVQWNSCYAAGSFFKALRVSEKDPQVSDALISKILDSITALMKSSTNYKVLSHSITAVNQLDERILFSQGKTFAICESLMQVFSLLHRQKESSLKGEEVKEYAMDFLLKQSRNDEGVKKMISEMNLL